MADWKGRYEAVEQVADNLLSEIYHLQYRANRWRDQCELQTRRLADAYEQNGMERQQAELLANSFSIGAPDDEEEDTAAEGG